MKTINNQFFSVKINKREEIESFLNHIARMRLDYFQQFPYLYKGKIEDENSFVRQYTDLLSGRVVSIHSNKDEFGGFVTGVGLLDSANAGDRTCNAIKVALGEVESEEIYYIGEAIFHDEYRGKGLLSMCVKLFEHEIRSIGFKKICFLTVIRPDNHPLKPKDYRDHQRAWEKKGYKKLDKTISIPWPVIQMDGNNEMQDNQLNIWIKDLSTH